MSQYQGAFILANSNGEVFTDANKDDLLLYSSGARILIGQKDAPAMLTISSNSLFSSNVTTKNLKVLDTVELSECLLNTLGSTDTSPILLNSDLISDKNVTLSNAFIKTLVADELDIQSVNANTMTLSNTVTNSLSCSDGNIISLVVANVANSNEINVLINEEQVATFSQTGVTMSNIVTSKISSPNSNLIVVSDLTVDGDFIVNSNIVRGGERLTIGSTMTFTSDEVLMDSNIDFVSKSIVTNEIRALSNDVYIPNARIETIRGDINIVEGSLHTDYILPTSCNQLDLMGSRVIISSNATEFNTKVIVSELEPLDNSVNLGSENTRFSNVYVSGVDFGIPKVGAIGSNLYITNSNNELLTIEALLSTTHLIGPIDASMIEGSLNMSRIDDRSIISSKLALESITTDIIADKSVTSVKMGDKTITSNQIADLTIISSNLALESITTDIIADKSVTSVKMGDKTITSSQIADLTIISSNLALESITTDIIADKSVTSVKMGDKTITSSQIADLTIGTLLLTDDAVTTDKLSNVSVTSEKIADGNILGQHIQGGAIDSYHIVSLDTTLFTSGIKKTYSVNLKMPPVNSNGTYSYQDVCQIDGATQGSVIEITITGGNSQAKVAMSAIICPTYDAFINGKQDSLTLRKIWKVSPLRYKQYTSTFQPRLMLGAETETVYLSLVRESGQHVPGDETDLIASITVYNAGSSELTFHDISNTDPKTIASIIYDVVPFYNDTDSNEGIAVSKVGSLFTEAKLAIGTSNASDYNLTVNGTATVSDTLFVNKVATLSNAIELTVKDTVVGHLMEDGLNIDTVNVNVLNNLSEIAFLIDGSNVGSIKNVGLQMDEISTSNLMASNMKVDDIQSSNVNTSNLTIGEFGSWDELGLQASNVEFSNCVVESNFTSKKVNTIDISAQTLYFVDANGAVLKEVNADTIFSSSNGGGGSSNIVSGGEASFIQISLVDEASNVIGTWGSNGISVTGGDLKLIVDDTIVATLSNDGSMQLAGKLSANTIDGTGYVDIMVDGLSKAIYSSTEATFTTPATFVDAIYTNDIHGLGSNNINVNVDGVRRAQFASNVGTFYTDIDASGQTLIASAAKVTSMLSDSVIEIFIKGSNVGTWSDLGLTLDVLNVQTLNSVESNTVDILNIIANSVTTCNVTTETLSATNGVLCSGVVIKSGEIGDLTLGSNIDLTKVTIEGTTIGSWTSNGLQVSKGIFVGTGDPIYDHPVRIEEMNIDNYSLYATGSLMARGYQSFSDIRIKTDIAKIDQETALDAVNALQPCVYKYKDKSIGKKAGFIAQDVEKCIPTAVSTCSEYIPDIMKSGTIIDVVGNVIRVEIPDIIHNSFSLEEGSIDIKLAFNKKYYYGSMYCVAGTEISIECKNLAHIETGSQIMFVGTKVEDFKVIEYEQIVSYLVSAVQALTLQLSSR
jgi:hypothetical protein